MTSTLAADSKLMFYPTDLKEVYRMAWLLSSTPVVAPYAIPNETAERKIWNDLLSKGEHNKHLLSYLLEKEDHAAIDYAFSFRQGYPQPAVTVLDPFAGKGEWLYLISETFGYKSQAIAIEIEKDRFDEIKADFKVNAAFEELSLPPKSISVLLYNPPYGFTNKIRNVRHYLQLILEQDILMDGAALACVIREDDAMGISDLLYSHFDLKAHYRVNEAEYAKYKQCVLLLKKRSNPVNLEQLSGMDGLETFRSNLESRIKSGAGFDSPDVRCGQIKIPDFAKNWEKLYNRHSSFAGRDGSFSSYDRVWDWVCKDSRAKLSENFSLVMPKNPKISELANLLASGIINGQIDDPEAPHFVSGGVKSVKRRETVLTENSKGEEVEQLKEVRFAQPYLSVLVVKDGTVEIKQIESIA